jgi:hypothetical protein
MHSLPVALAAAVLAALLSAHPAPAVIIDSGDGTGNTSPPADDPGWANVGRVNGLNAVYLGYGWVITAGHVGSGTLDLDGIQYPMVPGSWVQLEQASGVYADLGVFRVHPPPYALPALALPTSAPALGTSAVLLGFGQNRGAATTWHGIGGWLWGGGSTKRWGTNAVGADIDGLVTPTTVLTVGGNTTQSLVADFSENAPGDEASVAVGDSGGAFFVTTGGSWKLGGISFALGTYDMQPANTTLYGNVVYAADLAHYRAQVLAIARPCLDGVDNDGNGSADFPADAGCTWPGDPSERADCGDGIDNDADGAVDLADPFCQTADDAREAPDADAEGVADADDRCTLVANPTQLDTNRDGYGNACDADYDDDGSVGASDFVALRQAYGSSVGDPGYDPDLDANGDGAIGSAEFVLLRSAFGYPPGPSGLACAGTIPCP